MNSADLIYSLGSNDICLAGYLSGTNKEELYKAFQSIIQNAEVQQMKGIVYVWSFESPIKRLRGESDIVYIGMTTGTFSQRYSAGLNHETDEWNSFRYLRLFEDYGSIQISCIRVSNPKVVERKMLEDYLRDHFEYPPLNHMS
jgi:hypothetical protein